ncbi:male accessory gland serine protease inhibitor-like [Drosophila persimilis]|uniref:Male accessory gland serine protease inhibitor-like n=1 Tax=Drosophila pseudoobscura pseudoobscura TaxID=46245 RepID=A0A0R3NSS2_DROPS|nr:male accessory gland serine protease inhibitor [Drosophila pseudoobscura]XP_026844239.1 male accessory gland serine protease inhibitor-like [Drosophila persimilis]
MKFLLLLVVFATFVTSSLCLKHVICALPHSKNGDGNKACMANFPSWSYNGKECVRFIYGGCGGNLNRFPSQARCELWCKE